MYHPSLSPAIFHILCLDDVLNAFIMPSGLYSNIIWIASIGSSSGLHVFLFPSSPFASLSHLLRNILLTLLYSVIHLVVLGYSALNSSSKYCFYLRFIFSDSVKLVPCSSLACYMSGVSLHLLSSFDKLLYYISPSMVSSSVYNPS